MTTQQKRAHWGMMAQALCANAATLADDWYQTRIIKTDGRFYHFLCIPGTNSPKAAWVRQYHVYKKVMRQSA